MKLQSTLYNVGYPVYCAKFLNNSILLVAGGGGEGNNGIPNKLTALKINFEKKKVVKRFRELLLNENDDSPTTLDVAQDVILLGCNESSAKFKSGQPNHNLRKYLYENEHLRFVGAIDLNCSDNPEDYTKLLYMSQDGSVAAIASSVVPTVIRIVNPINLRETYEVETGNDVKDLHFSSDGKVLAYITVSTLEVISIVTGNFIVRKTDFDKNVCLSKIRFVGEDTILIAASLKKGTGIVLIKISLKKGNISMLSKKVVVKKFKNVTSIDVDPRKELVALAGSDNSVVIIKLKNLSVIKFFKQVHKFAVTRVAFSPDSGMLVSVSAANSIHVVKFPEGFATNTSFLEKVFSLFMKSILIVILSISIRLSYNYDMHLKAYDLVKKWTVRGASNSYLLSDIFQPQTTLVGDVISELTNNISSNSDFSEVHTDNWLIQTKSKNQENIEPYDETYNSSISTFSTSQINEYKIPPQTSFIEWEHNISSDELPSFTTPESSEFSYSSISSSVLPDLEVVKDFNDISGDVFMNTNVTSSDLNARLAVNSTPELPGVFETEEHVTNDFESPVISYKTDQQFTTTSNIIFTSSQFTESFEVRSSSDDVIYGTIQPAEVLFSTDKFKENVTEALSLVSDSETSIPDGVNSKITNKNLATISHNLESYSNPTDNVFSSEQDFQDNTKKTTAESDVSTEIENGSPTVEDSTNKNILTDLTSKSLETQLVNSDLHFESSYVTEKGIDTAVSTFIDNNQQND